MTDEQSAEFCSEHPDLLFEVITEGELIVMAPNYSLMGPRHREILFQLECWSRLDRRGVVNDAAAGFVLPNGARRSPDAAWIRKEQIRKLDPKMLERYWHLCPDFVIEVRSPSDRLRTLRDKMGEWMANGAQLGWLLDPENRSVAIYRPQGQVEALNSPESVMGEGAVDGFMLNLAPVWDPLGS
jgi:Uma2 family endonuclease